MLSTAQPAAARFANPPDIEGVSTGDIRTPALFNAAKCSRPAALIDFRDDACRIGNKFGVLRGANPARRSNTPRATRSFPLTVPDPADLQDFDRPGLIQPGMIGFNPSLGLQQIDVTQPVRTLTY